MSQGLARPLTSITLPLLLFGCGRAPEVTATDPYANGQSYPGGGRRPWLRRP